MNKKIAKLCAFHIYQGLCDGLSHFSGTSRAALIFAAKPDDSIHVYDPQNLLRGHEPRLKELYVDSTKWRDNPQEIIKMKRFGQPLPVDSPHLTGLISCGGRSPFIFYQMWFTEHHPDMCSTGPTERWLEQAVWLLSHDVGTEDTCYTEISGCVLSEYAKHAVRDYIVDELNMMLGMDIQIRIYPVLDAVLGISKMTEEGEWPKGQIVFVERRSLEHFDYLARIPNGERPALINFKHVRKLLQAVENTDRRLISDGKTIVGIATHQKMPRSRITADFRGGYGFLRLFGSPVCSFYHGNFQSSTRKPNLVQLEEILIDHISGENSGILFKIASLIVQNAEEHKHGCTLVIDLSDHPVNLAGFHPDTPLDLQNPQYLELAKSLSKLDGAIHIGKDMKLYGFACILDGKAIPGEDRARGARFNSALRFTAMHSDKAVIVVSADRPVSIFQEGVELNAQCAWKPVSSRVPSPPTLKEWIKGG